MNGRPAADVAVVGAGAAGLMAAIWAARTAGLKRTPLRVLLLDTQAKIGAKILMSGGTRCNVTNQEVTPSDFHGGPSHFVKHVFEAFTPQETIRFFESIGVELVLEPSGKYFPATHSARTVLDALVGEVRRLGVHLKTGIRITEVRQTDGLFHLKDRDGAHQIFARRAIITTGGLSHPTTGSDGTGYGIVRELGHTVVDTFPALTPLLTDDRDWKGLSGISLEARLSFFKNGKKASECLGSFLFTHFGFSGPASLDISRHFAGAKREEHPQITVSFLPRENEASLRSSLQSIRKRNPKKMIKNILAGECSLPERFVSVFLKKIGSDGNDLNGLVRSLLHYPLEVTGVFGYQKAEVTAGGVNLKEVKVSTMESKRAAGLYLAGEILDVDGRIGGFNFQWAWSTGAIAGRNAAESLTP